MPLLFGNFFLFLYIHSITFIQYGTFVHHHPSAKVLLSNSSSLVGSAGKTSLGCRAEFDPALQQADALPTELRSTLRLRCTLRAIALTGTYVRYLINGYDFSPVDGGARFPPSFPLHFLLLLLPLTDHLGIQAPPLLTPLVPPAE